MTRNDVLTAEFRAEPQPGMSAAIAAVTAAIVDARGRGARRLFLDLRDLRLPPPSLGQRHLYATEWARAAGGEFVLAVLIQEEMIDPEGFGVLVAQAAGLRVEVFADEGAARGWLARQPVAPP